MRGKWIAGAALAFACIGLVPAACAVESDWRYRLNYDEILAASPVAPAAATELPDGRVLLISSRLSLLHADNRFDRHLGSTVMATAATNFLRLDDGVIRWTSSGHLAPSCEVKRFDIDGTLRWQWRQPGVRCLAGAALSGSSFVLVHRDDAAQRSWLTRYTARGMKVWDSPPVPATAEAGLAIDLAQPRVYFASRAPSSGDAGTFVHAHDPDGRTVWSWQSPPGETLHSVHAAGGGGLVVVTSTPRTNVADELHVVRLTQGGQAARRTSLSRADDGNRPEVVRAGSRTYVLERVMGSDMRLEIRGVDDGGNTPWLKTMPLDALTSATLHAAADGGVFVLMNRPARLLRLAPDGSVRSDTALQERLWSPFLFEKANGELLIDHAGGLQTIGADGEWRRPLQFRTHSSASPAAASGCNPAPEAARPCPCSTRRKVS